MNLKSLTFSKKGALPVPYIVAMILAVIVIAIVVYWLFFSAGEGGNAITDATCVAKKMKYCNEWRLNSWGEMPGGDKEFSAGCNDVKDDRSSYYAPECCSVDWAQNGLSELECKSS